MGSSRDPDALVQVAQLPEAGRKGLIAEAVMLHDLEVGGEAYRRTVPVGIALSDDLDILLRHTAVVHLAEDLAVMVDGGLEPDGQGVDTGDADAMQAA